MTRTSDTPEFDQRIADWLEADSHPVPGSVLETVLAAAPLIKQRRVRAPWRSSPMSRLSILAAAALVAVFGFGGFLLVGRPATTGPAASPTPRLSPSLAPAATSSPSGTATAQPSQAARVDYSDIGGRILVEHLGNAIDGSEMPTSDYHPERRRLYWLDPANMATSKAVEFLPGQPSNGKLNADVSRDGRQVVFMDTGAPARVWIANADGTGLRNLSGTCACSELDPAFDPTGTKIVFVHLEGALRASRFGANLTLDGKPSGKVTSWLGIRDLATGAVTKLTATVATGADGLPYQPAWSLDGTRIAFNRTTWGAGGGNPTGTLQVVTLASGDVATLATPGASDPGDVAWSPDSSTLLFTDTPWSEMGSISGLPSPYIYTIGADGSGIQLHFGGAGASYRPDGSILYQANTLWLTNPQGTGALPVNIGGSDLSDLSVGFVYISHWVPTTP